jgi:hypothetical protein
MKLRYEPNPKHKEPWQSGRKGTLCPREYDLVPLEMLMNSILDGDKRYAVFNGLAYAAQCHRMVDGKEFWHGYPVAWVNVPESIRKQWIKENKVKRSMVSKFWTESDLENF